MKTAALGKKSLGLLVLALGVFAFIFFKNLPEKDAPPSSPGSAPRKIFDENGHKEALGFNEQLREKAQQQSSRLIEKLSSHLAGKSGVSDLISHQSGLVDPIGSTPQDYIAEFKLFVASPTQFESLIASLLRQADLACLESCLEVLRTSDSEMLKEHLLQRIADKQVLRQAAIIPSASQANLLFERAVSQSYHKAFLERTRWEKLRGTLKPKAVVGTIINAVSSELASLLKSRMHLYLLPEETFSYEYFSDKVFEPHLETKCFTDAFSLIAHLRIQNHFSLELERFVDEKLTDARIGDFLDTFAGVFDGSRLALMSDTEKASYTKKRFQEYIFSQAFLQKFFEDMVEEARTIAVEEANECAFEIELIKDSSFKRPEGFQLSIPQADSEITTLVYVFEMAEQIEIAVSAGLIIGGLAGAIPSGGSSLWVTLAGVVLEGVRAVGEALWVEADKIASKARIKEEVTSRIIKDDATRVIAKLREIIQPTFSEFVQP